MKVIKSTQGPVLHTIFTIKRTLVIFAGILFSCGKSNGRIILTRVFAMVKVICNRPRVT